MLLKSVQLQMSEWKKENTVYFIMLWCCTLALKRNVRNPSPGFSYFYFTGFGGAGEGFALLHVVVLVCNIK